MEGHRLNSPGKPGLADLGLGPALGYLALLPFVISAAGVHMGGAMWSALALKALVAYAAGVVSFIGALHWGLAFTKSKPPVSLLLWGICPAIMAWLSQLAPMPWGLWMLAALLLACYLVDRQVYRQQGVAQWLPLRLRLTSVATVCCMVGAMGAPRA